MRRPPAFKSEAHLNLSLAFPPEAAHGCAEDIEPRRPLFHKPSLWRRFIRFITRR